MYTHFSYIASASRAPRAGKEKYDSKIPATNVTEHRRLSGVTLVSGALLSVAFPSLDYSGCVVSIGLCVKELGSASLHPVSADKAHGARENRTRAS
jgi:hypothetical protein